jgi:hypothetical protein
MQYISVLKDGQGFSLILRERECLYNQISIYPTNIDIYDYPILELDYHNYIYPTPPLMVHKVYQR